MAQREGACPSHGSPCVLSAEDVALLNSEELLEEFQDRRFYWELARQVQRQTPVACVALGLAVGALSVDETVDLGRWLHASGARVGAACQWDGWERYIGPKTVPPARPERIEKVPIPIALRWEIWERDNFTCVSCGARRHLTVDHIVAESRGGTLALENLQTLCRPCNSRKGAR